MADTNWQSTSTPMVSGKPHTDKNPKDAVKREKKTKKDAAAELSVISRTRALFNIISRPPLLCDPSFGIKLPFESVNKSKNVAFDYVSKELKTLARADPCLLSIDGLLDTLFVTRNIIEHVYDVVELQNRKENNDTNTSTLNVLDLFLTRIDPILRTLGSVRISLKDFILGEIIGRGACGVVRIVQEKSAPNSVYAMKSQFKGSWLYHDPEGSQLLLERNVLAQAKMIDNPWLPHLYYAFQDEGKLHLVMDYEPGGDMYIFMTKAAHLLDPEMVQFYAAEVVEAAHSLHQMGYIHCDIKPENFAIERSGHLKLIDFGSAIRLDSKGQCICPTMVGTKEYLNIDLLTQRRRDQQNLLRVGPSYDYWAIGVFIYEMFYQCTPFYDDDEDVMMENIVNFKTTLHFPPEKTQVPESAKDLIRKLICDPGERLSYEDIVRHPFFQDVDFATIREHTPPYLPPVGDIDDVANFSGGEARLRDEMLHDMTNESSHHPRAATRHSDSAVALPRRLSNLENLQPTAAANDEEAKKRQVILEAVAKPMEEEIQEVEDIPWEGPAYALDLPFVGFSFTPTMLVGETRSRQRQIRSQVDQNMTVVQNQSSILDNSSFGEEALAKIMELKRRVRFLEKQRTAQEDEIQCLRRTLQKSVYNAAVIDDLEKSVTTSLKPSQEDKQLITKLEARINTVTLENAKLTEELNETRKCLLDFNSLRDLLNSVDRNAVDEAQTLRRTLKQSEDSSRLKDEEMAQLRGQLERLRQANTRLQAEREAAVVRAAKAEEAAAARADEAEAARAAANAEVLRLSTTAAQQGKLINHLLALLPPHQQTRHAADNVSEEQSSSRSSSTQRPQTQHSGRPRSRWLGKKTATGSNVGHSALFLKTRSMLRGKKAAEDGQQKKSTVFKSMVGLGSSTSSGNHRQQTKRRMAGWVRTLSTLRSKGRRGREAAAAAATTDVDDVLDVSDGEDYLDVETGGVYMGDNASATEYIVSDVDYIRGSASTIGSSTSLQSMPETAARQRRVVGWAAEVKTPARTARNVVDEEDAPTPVVQPKQREGHPHLLKQISRVLGKGKSKPHDDDA